MLYTCDTELNKKTIVCAPGTCWSCTSNAHLWSSSANPKWERASRSPVGEAWAGLGLEELSFPSLNPGWTQQAPTPGAGSHTRRSGPHRRFSVASRVPSGCILEDCTRFLFGCEKPGILRWAGRKMAAAVRQDLAQLMNSSGSHKDLAGK